MEQERVMNIKEVAEFFNISTQVVYGLVNNGRLPSFKVGGSMRIMYSDVLRFIQEQKQEFAKTLNGKNGTPSRLAVHQLSLDLGDFHIRDINFEVPTGKVVGILGGSGSGKTLILRAIAGLQELTQGSIYLNEQAIHNQPVADRKVGFVFENQVLFPHMNTQKNIEFPLQFTKMSKGQIQHTTDRHIHDLGIDEKILDQMPSQLSQGFKQLVSLAHSTNKEFDLLLMDEPLANLDAAQRLQMRPFLQNLIKELGKTTLITFHDPEEALVMSDYLAVMHQGALIQFGEKWHVYDQPVSLEAMALLSRQGLNTIPLAIKKGKTEPYGVEVDQADGDYWLAFRSEDIEVVEAGIPVSYKSSLFFDTSRKIAICHTEDTTEIQLIVPTQLETDFQFMPRRPLFFPRDAS